MEFFTVNTQPRPVTLSEETRQFAWDSLHYRYGLDTMKTPRVTLPSVPGDDPLDGYDAGIRMIAEQAPVRICEGEKISGAATLGDAIGHILPFREEGKERISAVSHLTADFESVLKRGIDAIRRDVSESLRTHSDKKELRFLQSCVSCLDSFDIWHRRYLDALKDLPEYRRNYEALLRVPHLPAESFYEAVQSIWFTFAFLRVCGNWPGIGRLDRMLGSYYENDVRKGVLTREEAKEILAHFFIKGCEWVRGGNYGSGDAQHYQNIVLSGCDENGDDVTNEVSFLVLEIIEELGISDFPTSVRLSSRTDESFKRRVAEAIRYGGGVIAVYNEDLILRSLTDYGYPLSEARNFANDGCWEIQIPGKTFFTYAPFDSLRLLQQITLKNYSDDVRFESFDQLLSAYKNDLREQVRRIAEDGKRGFSSTAVPTKDWGWNAKMPCTVISLFVQGCVSGAQSYLDGGPVYQVVSPHIGGLPDTVNSLYAIKKLVFDERKIGFSELMAVLRANWEGNEPLRQYAAKHYRYFGRDNDEADGIAKDLLVCFSDFCRDEEKNTDVRFPSGVSTFGRQIDWASGRFASPFGSRAGKVLSGNLSPTPGTDFDGATAVIRSYCKCALEKQTTGAALDVKLLSENLRGEAGITAITSLLDGFVRLGGCFMQFDVISAETLRDAQLHPENYQTLSVRVSGWSARFVTLNRQWQDMIIEQSQGKI